MGFAGIFDLCFGKGMSEGVDKRHSPIDPRGLSREAAASYIGIGATLFDAMVNDGRMPKPKLINSRKVWDRRELDIAFDRLPNGVDPDAEVNPFDGVRA